MDTTYSGNPTKPLNLETLKKAKEVLDKAEHGEPFAKFMEEYGFDSKKDYMVVPESTLREIADCVSYMPPLPCYVKISKYINKIVFVRGLYSGFLKKPALLWEAGL
jgi:hypothetical protein